MGYKTIFGIMIAYSVVCALVWLPCIATMKIGSGFLPFKADGMPNKKQTSKKKKGFKKNKKETK